MYERPQYMTPDGYRRKRANPSVESKQTPPGEIQQRRLRFFAARKKVVARGASREISDKAARLIAEALRAMLKS
jgi:hypothetical protein